MVYLEDAHDLVYEEIGRQRHLQRSCAIGPDGGEGHIGEVLDSAHLNPSAVFSIAQGKIPVAANT